MTGREIANLVEVIFFGSIIFLMCGIVLTFLSGILYMMLKKFFGKSTTETEPGQVPKKAKKAAVAPADAEELSPVRIEPTFGDNPVLAAHTTARLTPDAADVDAEPDAASAARDAAFADRMADQFAAEPVSA